MKRRSFEAALERLLQEYRKELERAPERLDLLEFRLGESTWVLLRLPTRELRSLSPRQREVARLAGRGYTVKAIATSLDLSPHSVDKHLREVYRKLGVESRAALAPFALAMEGEAGERERRERRGRG